LVLIGLHLAKLLVITLFIGYLSPLFSNRFTYYLFFFETDGHDIPVTHKDFPLINKLNTDDDKNIELVVKTDQTNNLAEVEEHQEVSEEL
jgi:hypothetical protein